MNIYIIDDDKIFQFVIKKLIQKTKNNISIDSFISVEEALNYFKEREKSSGIILLDINMPKLNGWDFLNEYKKLPLQNFQHDIYISSSSIAHSDKEKAKGYDIVKGYLVKPITKENLENLLG